MVRNLCHISWSILSLNSVHVCSSKISVVPRIYFCVLRDIILLLTVGLIVRYLHAFQLLVSVSDYEISAGLSITAVSVWLWDICRPFKYWCQCLIVRYLQVFQLLVSVCDCEISAILSSTGVSVWLWDICRPFEYLCQCLIVRYLQAFQLVVSVSDCELSAGVSSTGVSVWLWDICRPLNYWCQCVIVRYLQAFQLLVPMFDLRYLQAFKLLVPMSDCEISAGLSITGANVWLWETCRLSIIGVSIRFNPKNAATTHAKFRFLVLITYTSIIL